MKITKQTIKQLIKEEMEKIYLEQEDELSGPTTMGAGDPDEMKRKYDKVKQILAKLVSQL